MDESGFPFGTGQPVKVVTRKTRKCQHIQCDGNRENVSVIVTICANGTSLLPTVIFQAWEVKDDWHIGDPLKASHRVCITENGWTNTDIAVDWLNDFNNPHATHILQGLDVIAFAALKAAWTTARDAWNAKNWPKTLDKDTFLQVYGAAHVQALMEETILSSFAKTGIWPFNPDVISPEQLAPSIEHSTSAQLPLPVPSPIKLDPTLHTPITPTRDQAMPPAFAWAQRRAVDALESSFSFSSSSSFIVSSSPLRSTFKLPEHAYGRVADLLKVDWSLTKTPTKPWQSQKEVEESESAVWAQLKAAEEREVAVVWALDALNAQLALSGMAFEKRVAKNMEQIASEEKSTKKKREVEKEWKKFKGIQDAMLTKWQEEKAQHKAARELIPKAPKVVLKKDWMREKYPEMLIELTAGGSGNGDRSEGEDEEMEA
ncbi:hypothetical protein BS47DRAFT_1360752 [Hydnum rufescens UP504]|uniref:DDE-1 domain-containing protein n=1 Tax=Hydnum rufescens UP504 TaxID=1448309 RepID=A0A9P6B1J5_9AGAM|nr:hypothetical protein BS47DRAFT_1360752 [Hydnum rufescens UP504]